MMLTDKDIKVEKDCTHLVPPLKMDAATLHEIELQIFQMIIDFTYYAGNAFLSGDEEMMNIFKGQYIGLMRLQKWLSEKQLRLYQVEHKKEESYYADYVKEQMAILLPHDHRLLDEVVRGLQEEGWIEEGGSPTFRLLHKQGAAIKVFRDAEAPQVIKICFSAEPEEPEPEEPEPEEPEVDKGTHCEREEKENSL